MIKVVVLDANNRVSLMVVRALGKEGDFFIKSLEQEKFAYPHPPTFYSRFVRKRNLLPDSDNHSVYINALIQECNGFDVLIPVSTNSVLFVSRWKDVIENFNIKCAVGSFEKIRFANNKRELTEFAKNLDISVPKTVILTQQKSALECGIGYPCVLKISDDEGLFLSPEKRYFIARNDNDFFTGIRKLGVFKKNILVQEYIEGSGYGYSACVSLKSGEILAEFCHRRLMEYPITGGPSVLCESIIDDDLITIGRKLISELKWSGVCMLEFRKSKTDSKYYLMELNPRFWGSMALATECGVNFPALLCRDLMGFDQSRITKYKKNQKMCFILSYIVSIIALFRTGVKLWRIVLKFFGDIFDMSTKEGLVKISDPFSSIMYILSRFLFRKKYE